MTTKRETMTQHTPGPWEIEMNGRARMDVSAPEDQCGGYLIATMTPNSPCKEANARLIAAAPALLAVAEGALGYLEALPESARPDAAWFVPLRAAIHAAREEN